MVNITNSFTTHKKRAKTKHLIGFKLDDEGKKELDEVIWFLQVEGKRTSEKMRDFVDKVHKALMESGNKDTQLTLFKKETEDLNARIKALNETNTRLAKRIDTLEGREKTTLKPLPSTVSSLSKPKPLSLLTMEPKPLPQRLLRVNEKTTMTREKVEIVRERTSQLPQPHPMKENVFHRSTVERAIRKGNVPEWFTCKRDNKAYHPLNLPCMKDLNLKCEHELCHKNVLKMVGAR